jgi:TIR domain
LSGVIEESLKKSEILIVICSPDSAQSQWVSEEIRLFRRLPSEVKIIPILRRGAHEESFPEALLENQAEPLAATVIVSEPAFQVADKTFIETVRRNDRCPKCVTRFIIDLDHIVPLAGVRKDIL